MATMVHLRRLVVITIIVGLSSTAAGAGHDAEDAALPGRRSSVEFRVNDSFTLDGLMGISIAWKTRNQALRGWRIGLTPELLERDELTPDFNARHRQRGLIIEGQRLGFIDIHEKTRLCLGLGLFVGTGRVSEAEGSGETDVFHRAKTNTSYEAGLVGTLGAEYTIIDRVVIGLEVGATAAWTSRRVTDMYWASDPSELVVDKDQLSDVVFTARKVAVTLAILF